MPTICPQCGKEHATKEELESLTSGRLVNSSNVLQLGEVSTDLYFQGESIQKKIKLKKKE